jgi:hypothetical protein
LASKKPKKRRTSSGSEDSESIQQKMDELHMVYKKTLNKLKAARVGGAGSSSGK